MDGRVATARRKLAEVQGIFQALQARATEAPKIEAEFTNLTRDYEVFRSSYDTLLQRRESARIAAAADSTAEPMQFRLVAAPELPARPSGPNRNLFNSVVLLSGLLAGGGFAFLLGKIDDRIVVAEDFEAFLGTRVLGSISDTSVAPKIMSRAELFDKFGYTTTALAAAFGIVLIVQPNLSMLVKAAM